MKVAGYVRVSTEEQAKEGVSLDAQEAKIKTYCSLKDWKLEGIYKDEGISGKSLERAGIQEVLQRVDKQEIDILIVYKLDRLTRSVKDLNLLIELFDKKKISLVSTQENLDATTATGKLMMNLLASVSQWEREVIGERTRMAMRYLRDNQKVYSRPVFGFDIVDGQLVEDTEEQRIIKLMEELRGQGKTYKEIAQRLKEEEIKTKRGGNWEANTVRKILKRKEETLRWIKAYLPQQR
jgi:DNA invertase Pin-like site-specific DNA recombinase